MAEPRLGWLNIAFEARKLDDDSQGLELEEERKFSKNMKKYDNIEKTPTSCTSQPT